MIGHGHRARDTVTHAHTRYLQYTTLRGWRLCAGCWTLLVGPPEAPGLVRTAARAGSCVGPVMQGVRHARRGTVAVASVWRGILMAWYPGHTGGAEWKDDQRLPVGFARRGTVTW
jgi:hypothetical protein